jgi:hypothetical protein
MIKRTALTVALVASALPALAQNPRGEAKATVSGKAVSIDYGRPSLNGRDMLAKAEVGQAWRLGADAATTLKTAADLDFGGKKVPKGDYTLTATKVEADKWVLNVAGKDAKVAEIPLTNGKADAPVETFTIDLTAEKDKGDLTLSWGSLVLKTSFTGK